MSGSRSSVCLFVLGRHVPQLAFFEVLLGNERVLTYEERLRQRLLALDPDEATAIAEEYLQDHTLEEFYDDVAIPALVSIERDRASGALYETRRSTVAASVLVMIDNLLDATDGSSVTSEIGDKGTTHEMATNSNAPRFPERSDLRVLCVGARGGLDDAAAAIFVQCAIRRGIAAKALSRADSGSGPAELARTDIEGTKMMCLLYLSESSIAPARYQVRRLQRRMPTIPILAAFLSLPAEKSVKDHAKTATNSDHVSCSLADTLDQIVEAWSKNAKAEPTQKNTITSEQIAAGA